MFGDEHGGRLAHRCNGQADLTGNIWFYKNVPPGSPEGRCSGATRVRSRRRHLHNFNVISINDKKAYIGVSSTYEGGTTVFKFTPLQRVEAAVEPLDAFVAPVVAREIAFYDAQTGARARVKGAPTRSLRRHVRIGNDFLYAKRGLREPTPTRQTAAGLTSSSS